ncbi:MAG: protein-L-isoaspartate O-methyltransferase [Hyphomicrobiales bacterium]|nr:MAG: protein-L-isoaspartate O-methyltransferase [Hyphomicrobiales bacterium]
MNTDTESHLPDFETRQNAIGALLLQLRTMGITDHAILQAFENTRRDLFVPLEFSKLAMEDRPVQIECGQLQDQPCLLGQCISALEISPNQKIFEIGTGSGYLTAILARLCRRVFSVERHRHLVDLARARLKAFDLQNTVVMTRDGYRGLAEQAPIDRIISTAAVETIPELLLGQLAESGRMILPLGPAGGFQELTLFTKINGTISTKTLMKGRFSPMISGLAPRS